jgi:hypothetical protein
MASTLQEVLEERFPWMTLVGPDEAGKRLAVSSVATDYGSLMADYHRTGVADTRRLARVAWAVGTDHFMEVRLAYEEEDFLDPLLFSFDEFREENRQVIVLVARMWMNRGPGPVWEAVIRTTSETDDIFAEGIREVDELILDTAIGLADRIPVAAPEGQGPQGFERLHSRSLPRSSAPEGG